MTKSVSSNLRHAALKSRKAIDRAKYYDEGKPYGKYAYVYIIPKEKCIIRTEGHWHLSSLSLCPRPNSIEGGLAASSVLVTL